jgi:hypothetical protein
MVKTEGGVFATPDDGVLTSTLVRMTQEIEVSTAHEPQAAAAETDGPIAQIVGLPIRPGWNAGFAEQGSGDHAIRMAGKASVESAEGKFEPPASLGRHAPRRPVADPAGRGAPQTERRFRAYGKICVERDHDGSRRCGAGTADEDDRQTVVPVVNEPMLTVGGPARECRPQVADRARFCKRLRSRSDENGGGIEIRQPYDQSAIGPADWDR